MIDPTQAAVGERLLAAVRERSVAIPGFEDATEDVRVSLIGTGESYAAWRLADGTRSVVVRMPRRPPGEMPTPMTDEFDAAPLIDPGLGSRALAMDAGSDNPLGTAYLVSTFVPGSIVAASNWDEPLLMAHARQLAALHGRRFESAGPVGGEGAVLDIVDEFDGGYRWWQETYPDVTRIDGVAALADAVRAFLVDVAPWFGGIDYAFIHGDLVATNVVVDEGVPRYIDWEWARIGDVAQDLAAIGGRVFGGPWYVPMGAATIDRYLEEYVRAGSSPGGQTSLEGLRHRRDAWELSERFLTSLHFMKQSRTLAAPGPYPDAARTVQATLRARLGLEV